jgi:hypothetical protein
LILLKFTDIKKTLRIKDTIQLLMCGEIEFYLAERVQGNHKIKKPSCLQGFLSC